MLPVAGRPLVEHVVDAAVGAGASEIVLVVGYEGERIRSHFDASGVDVPIHYATQSEQQGTADAVAAAGEYLDGPFAVLNGDNLYRADDIRPLFDAAPAVACVRVDTPSNYGVLSTDDGRVTGVREKPDDPPSNLANAGAYAFPDAARSKLDVQASERGERELTDVLDSVVDTHDVSPVRLDEWLDVGRPWELLAANERRLGAAGRSVEGEVHPDADLEGAVVVEPGASVGPGTVVEGPVRIQSGASVGPNAYVRGATLVGPDASVGHAAEVKNSVLMRGATVAHLTYVGDSVLGRDVNLGAGTNVANLRHDEREIRYTVKGRQVSTGRRKFGVVLGDEVHTGINTSLDPGVRLEAGATTIPGERVSRDD
jgi:bifunctional UDP-N-acetylglucosamine pyrophosphorylase/glucosamine-1-phosphate N-acetyltransferase